MKVLSVANEKGGTGKTVLAANLAWEFSRKGYLVLIVDLDQQRDLTKILFRGEEIPRPDIFDLLNHQCRPEEACVEVKENLHLIPGSGNIKHYDFKRSETLLKEILAHEDLKQVDLVIIDNPPSTSEITLLGYVAATDVLIVTDPEMFGVENMGEFLDDLASVKQNLNRELRVIGVVANRVDMRRNLTKKVMSDLKWTLGETFLNTFVSNNVAIPTSIWQRKTVRELGWSNPAVKQLKDLANELEERMWGTDGVGQA
ncbi:MAG TPA: ParA family protein [Desulfosporosinus sp.]